MTERESEEMGQRRTKIVCTIGPATASEARLRALIANGMNVARLNFSHGEHGQHAAVVARIRTLADELGVAVAILQDLAGPKVRIGTLAEEWVELQPAQPFTLTTRPIDGSRERVSVSYAGLPAEVQPGDALLMADGTIELRVEQVTADEIRCRVVVGGRLGSRKGINVPSGLGGLPILGDRDLEDLRFGVAQGMDYVGLSFVRTAADVRTARARIEALGGRVPVIAKIETQAALEQFDEILDAADGIMIARGDLSIETPFTRVPVVQKRLIAQANRRARPVITATHMLLSMVSAPHPTRAEVADVANAIIDGSDAVMLSEETAIGEHPVRAVEVMAAIALETERAALHEALPFRVDSEPPISDEEAVVHAACQLAARLPAAVIVTVTHSGETARLAAKYRPAQPILAPTGAPEVYRRLALVRDVTPLLVPGSADDLEATLVGVRRAARHHGWEGTAAVFVARDRLWKDVL
jgi:pyruvate kinase